MLGLKSPTKEQQSRVRDEPDRQRKATPSPNRSLISSKRVHLFGRHLSFNLEDNAMQLAAASRLGPWTKLMDVRKVYISSSLSPAKERQSFIVDTINDYVKEFGGGQPTISLTVQGPETASRVFLMPWLARKELDSAIQFEAKRQIPFPIDESEFDYRLIEKTVDGDHKQIKVSMLAATRRLISDTLLPFDQLGLKVAHVFHSQDIIGQLLPTLPGFHQDNTYTMINIQQRSTVISYYWGAQLVFFHISPVGSSLLGNHAVPTTFDYFTESLASEIQNSLDYYTGQFPTQLTNEILVYGDFSYADELIELLGDRSGFSFQRFPAEDLSFIKGKNRDFEGSLSVCLPVLASVVRNTRLPDLLPRERRLSRSLRRLDKISFFSLATLLVFLCGGWFVQAYQLHHARDRSAQLTRQLESVRSSPEFHVYNMLKQQIAVNQSYLERIKETPSYLGLNLKELSRLTPVQIRLYYLEYDASQPERNFSIFGIVSNSKIPPEIILAEYVETLRSSPFYDDVVVTRHAKQQVGKVLELDFQISARGII